MRDEYKPLLPEKRRNPGDYHGTINGYNKHKCRCELCRRASYELRKSLKHTWARRKHKPVPHGTLNCYGYYQCRCELCRQAVAANRKELRQNGKNASATL